jgi:hypothetical protein
MVGESTAPATVSGMTSPGSFVWSRSSTGAPQAAVGTRGTRLCVSALRAHQSGNTNDADSRLPSIGHACDADSCLWTTGRVRAQVLGQHHADGALGLRVRIGRGKHGQPGHVRAHGAVLFSFQDDRVEHCHSTPASRSMRLPSRPASFLVWTATHTSLPVVGCRLVAAPVAPADVQPEPKVIEPCHHLVDQRDGELELLGRITPHAEHPALWAIRSDNCEGHHGGSFGQSRGTSRRFVRCLNRPRGGYRSPRTRPEHAACHDTPHRRHSGHCPSHRATALSLFFWSGVFLFPRFGVISVAAVDRSASSFWQASVRRSVWHPTAAVSPNQLDSGYLPR